jgi:hypothetical protein
MVADLLGLVGFASFIAVSLVVGVRLLALARRTRKLPELAIGLDLVLAGAIGYSLLLAAESLHLLPAPLDGLGSFAGVLGISVGSGFVALFSRQVFRPSDRGSRAALVAVVAWLALGVYGSWGLHVGRVSTGVGGWLGHWAPNLGILAAYGWSTFESLRYYALMRRRVRLGIADPLVANRFLLWGLGTLAVSAVALLHLVAQLLGTYELPPSFVSLVSALVLVAAVAEWLAFFPPAAYRRRFRWRTALGG